MLTDSQKINKLIRIMFPNGETDFTKSLWRQSSGSKSRAFNIALKYAENYDLEIDEYIFDHACAEITGGCEVEWGEE